MKMLKWSIYLTIFILCGMLVIGIGGLEFEEIDKDKPIITTDSSRTIYVNSFSTQSSQIVEYDTDFPVEYFYENVSHYVYKIEYGKDLLLKTKISIDYNTGIPLWEVNTVTKTIDSKTALEVVDLSTTSKIVVEDITMVVIPKIQGIYHIGNESTIITVINSTVGLNINTTSNYGVQLTANDTTLLRYITFDIDMNGSTPVKDISMYRKDPNTTVFTNGNQIIEGADCYKGKCWNQDGTDANQGTIQWTNFLSAPDLNLSKYNETGFAVFARVKSYSNSSNMVVVGITNSMILRYTTSGVSCLFNNNVTRTVTVAGANISQSYLIGCIYNSTHIIAYRDSATTSYETPLFYFSNVAVSIGSDQSGSYWNGTIDEVMIYNRSFNETEVLELYNTQTPRYYATGKYVAEVVNLTVDSTSIINEDRMNITWYCNQTIASNCSIRIRTHNISLFSPGNLIAWWDFNTVDYTHNAVKENTGLWESPNHVNLSMRMDWPTRNITINENSYFERGLDTSTFTGGNLPVPHGLTEKIEDSGGRFINFTGGNFTACVWFNSTAITGVGTGFLLTFNYQIFNIRNNNVNASHTDVATEARNESNSFSIGNNAKIYRHNIWTLACVSKNQSNISQIVFNEDFPTGHIDSRGMEGINGSNYIVDIGICNSGIQYSGINGTCDEVMIWNTTLFAEQLADIYQNKYHWSNWTEKNTSNQITVNINNASYTQIEVYFESSNLSNSPTFYNYSIELFNSTEGETPIIPIPSQVENLTNLSITNSSIEIQFNYTDIYTEKALILLDGINTANLTYPTNISNLTSLTANTQYNITVKAYNESGINNTITTENSILITTMANPITIPIINQVENITDLTKTNTSINISWSYYNTDGGYLVYLNNSLYVNITNYLINSSNISSLNASTSYNITVFAYNDTGVNQTVSAENSIIVSTLTTPVVFTPLQIENLINQSVTNTSVFISLNYTDVNTTKAIIYINGSNTLNLTYPDIDGNLTSLLPNTQYNITVNAYNTSTGENTTQSSENSILVTTLETSINIPQIFNLSSPFNTTSSIFISFNYTNNNITTAAIYKDNTYVVSVAYPDIDYNITGLSSNTQYNITVLANNTRGYNTSNSTANNILVTTQTELSVSTSSYNVTINGTNITDTYVTTSLPTTNFGTEDVLQVNNNSGGGIYREIYMKFNISGFSNNSFNYVTNAILTLYIESLEGTNNITMHQLWNNFSWHHTSVTYNSGRPTVNDYNNTAANYTTVSSASRQYDFNITNILNNCVQSVNANCSIIILGSANNNIELRSIDNTNAFTPRLNITYSVQSSPSVSNFKWVNGTNHTGSIGYNFSLSSNSALSFWWYGTNQTGTWVNSTKTTATGTQYNGSFLYPLTINQTNRYNCFYVFFNNTDRYNGSSELNCLTIKNTITSLSSVEITPDPASATDDLNCDYTGLSNPDGDGLVYYYNWYKNLIATNINDDQLDATNTSAGEDWYCSIIVYDNFENSTAVNSQTVTIDSTFSAPSINWVNATSGDTGKNSSPTNPTYNNSFIQFWVNFTDANDNDENYTAYFCKTNQFSNPTCTGGLWNYSIINSTYKTYSTVINVSSLSGDYNFYAFVIDNNSYASSSYLGNFSVDTPPSSPTYNVSVTTYSKSTNVSIILSSTDAESDSINYSVWNSSSSIYTQLNVTASVQTFVNQPEGNMSFYSFAMDQHYYNSTNTSLYKFVFDYTQPNLTIQSPDGDYSSRSITLLWVANDSYISTCSYNVSLQSNDVLLYKTNRVVNCVDSIDGFTMSLDGDFTLNMCAYDLAGNNNCTSKNFSIDTTGGDDGGGGGGGGDVTIVNQTTINQTIISSSGIICNYDTICQSGETFFGCSDCREFGAPQLVLLVIVGLVASLIIFSKNEETIKKYVKLPTFYNARKRR